MNQVELITHKLQLPKALPAVLGVGAYLKNALCLIQGAQAWISRENGSLDNVEAITRFQQTASDMLNAATIAPVAVAHDWHPDFYSSRWAMMESGLRPVGIQHHHAHVAAIMAEHGVVEPMLGLALDGFGLGENKQAWGGELLLVDAQGFKRLGHLAELPQAGGDIAARQPWRMGAGVLWMLGRGDEIAARYADQPAAKTLTAMLERKLNAPMTSSAGRLFDAACGLLNVLPVASFEGEAPMKLEHMVTQPVTAMDGWRIDENMVLDMMPTMAELIDKDAVEGANLFHGTLAAALVDWAVLAANKTGVRQVALCGGCFFNKVLRERVQQGMMDKGITPLLAKQLLPGDTAIALGQAYAAALKLMQEG